MSIEYIFEESIINVLNNIDGYIKELSGKVNDDIINKLKMYYNETKNSKSIKRFNLVYRDGDRNIYKVCNESFIYEYVKKDDGYYRIRTEIDDNKPFVYPPEKVNDNKADEDIKNMESRPIIYVDLI